MNARLKKKKEKKKKKKGGKTNGNPPTNNDRSFKLYKIRSKQEKNEKSIKYDKKRCHHSRVS